MASRGAFWGPTTLRLLRVAVTKTSKVIRHKLADIGKPFQRELQTVPLRYGYADGQRFFPAALLRQQKRGLHWFSNSRAQSINRVVRRLFTSRHVSSPGLDRNKLPSSKTSRRVAQISGRAPLASILRPNLTGGSLPRSAGGYSLGGGARYFSHTPAAPAQVVQNVSQAMRAFFLSGQKFRYDGLDLRGQRQYRAVSCFEDDAMNKLSDVPRWYPGSFIDFKITPTITAMSPLASALTGAPNTSGFRDKATTHPASLDTEGFLDVLSTDFGRALQDLAIIHSDLRRLSTLGSLPIFLKRSDSIRVRFPGVDALTVERLCDDLGIQRGVIGEDPTFNVAGGVPVALKFPLAPEVERVASSPNGSARSLEGSFFHGVESSLEDDLSMRDAFAYQTTGSSPEYLGLEGYHTMSLPIGSGETSSDQFEGLEGIYRFIEECDRATGRVGSCQNQENSDDSEFTT